MRPCALYTPPVATGDSELRREEFFSDRPRLEPGKSRNKVPVGEPAGGSTTNHETYYS